MGTNLENRIFANNQTFIWNALCAISYLSAGLLILEAKKVSHTI